MWLNPRSGIAYMNGLAVVLISKPEMLVSMSGSVSLVSQWRFSRFNIPKVSRLLMKILFNFQKGPNKVRRNAPSSLGLASVQSPVRMMSPSS